MENNIQHLLSQFLNTQGITQENTQANDLNVRWQSILRDTIRELLPPTATASPATAPAAPMQSPELSRPIANHFVGPASNTQQHINSRQLDTIHELIHEYNRNMRDYNRNISDIIEMLNVDFSSTASQNTTEPVRTNHSIPIAQNHENNTNNHASVLLSYYTSPWTNINNIDASNNVLSRSEIAIATQTYGYTEDLALHTDSSANVCPISLDTFQVGDVVCEIIGCGHIFKRPSLMNWLRRNSRCPVCRYQLRDYINNRYIPTESERPSDTNTSTEPAPITPTETAQAPSFTSEMMSRIVQSMMSLPAENRQTTTDPSGNAIYEFDIPLDNIFAPSQLNNPFYNIINTQQYYNNEEKDNDSEDPEMD